MKKLFLLVFAFASMEATPQSLTPTVVASSGGFYSNPTGMLSFTVGELAAVTTLTSASNILTQGFQQQFDFSVGISDVKPDGFDMQVYPNPGNGSFQIGIQSESNFSVLLQVHDLLGKQIFSKKTDVKKGTIAIPLELNTQSEGIYLLECYFTPNKGSGQSFSAFSKLNIIR